MRELVDAGAATPGEIVLLFAAGTDAEWYEEELRALGLPTYRATGRRYFGQQQVVDLLMYLRLLRNRYDDEALTAVLASPFVGVSNDGLVLIRRHAGRRPLFTGIERSLPDALSERDERLVRAFKQRYERLVAAAARVSLERLCELVVSEHDYDLAVLARWDGRRRYANLRKLMRLARTYEEVRGRDLEGFVGFLRDQETLGAAQLEAVSEEEGADAVRLLTIHAAKGLEFKVVVVADAGRDLGGPPPADEILALSDGRFGFKVVHPTSGERKAVFGYDEVLGAEREAGRAERLRLYYVAMTRAIDRLLVSGAVGEARDTPIGWVLSKLDCEAELARREHRVRARARRRLVPRPRRPRERARARARDRGAGATAKGSSRCSTSCRRRRRPAAGCFPSSCPCRSPRCTTSASSPTRRSRCSSAARTATTPSGSPGCASGAPAPAEGDGLAATEIGDAAHRLLELVDMADPDVPELDVVRSWYPDVSDEELERIAGVRPVVLRLAARAAGRRASRASGPSGRSRSSTTGSCCDGRLDVLHRRDGRGARRRLQDERPRRAHRRRRSIESDYRLQRLVYALACFRAGDDEVEIVYVFLERPDGVVSATFTPRRSSRARGGALGGDRAGSRRASSRRRRATFTCAGCPALDVICAGPKLRGRPAGGPMAEPAGLAAA